MKSILIFCTKETLDTYAHMFPNNLGDVKNTIDNLNLGI